MPDAQRNYDAVVIGSGPNGLSAAITLAQAGRSVAVFEGQSTIGGGARSAELTLPGFVHDVCSAVHPMGVTSPFFRSLPLEEYGLEWIQPAAPLAHPLDDGTAVILERSIEETAANFGEDAERYVRFFAPLVSQWSKLENVLLGPLKLMTHPLLGVRFGIHAMRSGSAVARSSFRGERARALFAGIAAHSVLPLEDVPSAAFGVMLQVIGHAAGWPFARGGSQAISNALAEHLKALGGDVISDMPIESLDQVPRARTILCDVTPRQLLAIAGSRLTESFRRLLALYRYGPGVCKVDWAVDAPIPWAAEECRRAGTVHLGGTLEEMEVSERAPWQGEIAQRPFVLLAQPTLFDTTRAPSGKHIAWAYCHVPNGSNADVSDRIEQQVERFAPGFRQHILKRSVKLAASMERFNANLVGGDISGGAMDLAQFFLRPTRRQYRTSAKGLYLCSASTPPGGGVHGLCGYLAAQAALSDGL